MKITTDEWIGWLKCNALEIITLILVLVLVGKAFSAPAAVEGISEVQDIVVVEEPAVSEEASVEAAPVAEVPLEGAPTEEVPVVETLTE